MLWQTLVSHGSNDGENGKPHYFSVMNYDYQLTGVPKKDGTFYLRAPSDLKTIRFPAQAVSHGRGISPEPSPEIEINLIAADDAREQGLIP